MAAGVERTGLEHRARRVELALHALRARSRAGAGLPRLPMARALASYEAELRRTRERLRRLDTGR